MKSIIFAVTLYELNSKKLTVQLMIRSFSRCSSWFALFLFFLFFSCGEDGISIDVTPPYFMGLIYLNAQRGPNSLIANISSSKSLILHYVWNSKKISWVKKNIGSTYLTKLKCDQNVFNFLLNMTIIAYHMMRLVREFNVTFKIFNFIYVKKTLSVQKNM